jgi:Fur family ferric uptake transcriptional regulator
LSDPLRSLLVRHDLRATRGRLNVLAVLQSTARPLSAAEVHERLAPERADLATVYRSLESFADRSMVRPVVLRDGVRRFELAERKHHHHLICDRCGSVQDLAACNVSPFESMARDEHGFQVTDHAIEFFGICQGCRALSP